MKLEPRMMLWSDRKAAPGETDSFQPYLTPCLLPGKIYVFSHYRHLLSLLMYLMIYVNTGRCKNFYYFPSKI